MSYAAFMHFPLRQKPFKAKSKELEEYVRALLYLIDFKQLFSH